MTDPRDALLQSPYAAPEVKETLKSLQVDTSVRELRVKYPWAKASGSLSEYARAAANLRTELGLTFPGVKFSVTSKSYSGGDSVRYEWALGPTGKEVEDIADKYAYGRFDSMQDLSTSDHSVFGEAVGIVLGRAKYVMGYREIPEHIHEQIGRLLCEAQRVEFQGDLTMRVFGAGDGRPLREHVRELLARTSFPLGSEIAGIAYRESGYNEMTGADETGGYYLTFKDCDHNETIYPERGPGKCAKCGYVYGSSTKPSMGGSEGLAPVNSTAGVTVTENIDKGGIEIRFASKPAHSVLAAIHAQNAGYKVWRWHKTGKFWYAKASDNTRAFAQSLKGGE